MKLYANRLGMIPSTEIALMLRVAAERERLAEARAAPARGARERARRCGAGSSGRGCAPA